MSKIATELQCYFIGMKGIRPTSTQNKCATYQKAKEYGCTIVNYTPKDNQLIEYDNLKRLGQYKFKCTFSSMIRCVAIGPMFSLNQAIDANDLASNIGDVLTYWYNTPLEGNGSETELTLYEYNLNDSFVELPLWSHPETGGDRGYPAQVQNGRTLWCYALFYDNYAYNSGYMNWEHVLEQRKMEVTIDTSIQDFTISIYSSL